jgi:hypothetical protein
MSVPNRPKYFYLFKEANDIVIHEMTDADAAELWKQGKYWEDMPQKTAEQATALRLELLTQLGAHRVQ